MPSESEVWGCNLDTANRPNQHQPTPTTRDSPLNAHLALVSIGSPLSGLFLVSLLLPLPWDPASTVSGLVVPRCLAYHQPRRRLLLPRHSRPQYFLLFSGFKVFDLLDILDCPIPLELRLYFTRLPSHPLHIPDSSPHDSPLSIRPFTHLPFRFPSASISQYQPASASIRKQHRPVANAPCGPPWLIQATRRRARRSGPR
jgi:hypothetical protein